MANQVYNSFKKSTMLGEINFLSDTIKIALTTSAYIPDIDNHKVYSDITNEIIGVGYTSGGMTISGITVTIDYNNDKSILDALDVIWHSSTIEASGAVIYKSGITPNESPLIGFIDFEGVKSSFNGDFVIQWNSNGILVL